MNETEPKPLPAEDIEAVGKLFGDWVGRMQSLLNRMQNRLDTLPKLCLHDKLILKAKICQGVEAEMGVKKAKEFSRLFDIDAFLLKPHEMPEPGESEAEYMARRLVTDPKPRIPTPLLDSVVADLIACEPPSFDEPKFVKMPSKETAKIMADAANAILRDLKPGKRKRRETVIEIRIKH